MNLNDCDTKVKKIVVALVFDLLFTLICLTSLAKFVFEIDCLATRIERI